MYGYYVLFSYLESIKNGEESGIILRISDKIGITPVLVAKFILEAFVLEQHNLKLKELEEERNSTSQSTEEFEGRTEESKIPIIYALVTKQNGFCKGLEYSLMEI